ncbi:HNH endonuclease signature motif containing protein [Mammaliicoccus sciuri]|jgi:5-methylcytosine-specific restriction endonuclease McrA|uniref:HNH endonuclease n=1 Tax=Mammaliicoccus sciuri TaxID=1296 RepID=UPI0028872C04|nr:HNH endonuclease signature motif containing protein [Mammaliicoccus sciuri]MDT0703917.1 HNH endonuclease signature motif containing protein [Mammaliicoccus sciuri]
MNNYKHGRKEYQYDWFYHSSAWRTIRQMALERDNHLCQMCLEQNEINDAEIVHHIVYVNEDFEKALDLNNLMCVCSSCHNKIHANDNQKNKNRNIKIIKL